jgi:hypothetical protein
MSIPFIPPRITSVAFLQLKEEIMARNQGNNNQGDNDRQDDGEGFFGSVFGGIGRGINGARDAVADFIQTRGEEVEACSTNSGAAPSW